MNRPLLVLACLLLQPLLFSCQDPETEVAPIERIIPLQVGNQWLYEVSDYDGQGQVLSTYRFTRSVLRDTLINGSTWYLLNDNTLVQNSDQGYVYYNRAGHEPVILYPNATYGGIGYSYRYTDFLLWVLTTRTSQAAPVANIAGNFTCYEYAIEKQYTRDGKLAFTVKEKNYVAPEKGIVRSDLYYADSDNLFRRQELVSYRLQ
ncbi:hypothetical protein [Pontibacter chitinilyticus]|uniref:hypothetical protein n=1 Tax=Pontibacter chitinilyticus TaxID=2674989 RepID=UPI00321BCE0C